MRKMVLVFGTVMACLTQGAYAGPIALLSHRATYDMNLASSEQGSGVVGAHGTMTYEFTDSCDGWVTDNRFAVTYAYAEGAQVVSTTEFITWESKDGLKYRFRMRSTRDGEISEDIEGTAQLKSRGEAGLARFTRPEEASIPLPKGTVFPTEHTRHLMDGAAKGATNVRRVVFDGSDVQGAFDVNALIGVSRRLPAADEFTQQLDGPSWPMRLAFFNLKGDEPEPDFEMSAEYHANGVAQSIVQRFHNFSLIGRMTSIESLPKPSC